MPVTIEPQERDDHYSVNGKTVYKDQDGNFMADEPLTDIEKGFFREYRKALEVLTKPVPMKATFTV